ncbi:MAG: hypothetical protein ACI307_08680 [Sodaliphilus sp.]
MKKVFDFIFFIFSKEKFENLRGDVFSAVCTGYSFPMMFVNMILHDIANKIGLLECVDDKMKPPLFMLTWAIMLILIYLFYKRGGKGEQIINHYENEKYKKYHKWYYFVGVRMALVVVCLFLSIFVHLIVINI